MGVYTNASCITTKVRNTQKGTHYPKITIDAILNGGPLTPDGDYFWTDGTNTYYANNYVLNGNTLEEKTWTNAPSFSLDYLWTDGTNVYSSRGTSHYVLNKETSTWEEKVWNVETDFYGYNVWSDGENYYLNSSYVLNKETSTWEEKVWNGFTGISSSCIWSDGTNIYYSGNDEQYVLNKETSTWEEKVWNGLTSFSPDGLWTDGTYIFNDNGYVLNGDTWEEHHFTGDFTDPSAFWMWSDGTYTYGAFDGALFMVIPSTAKLYYKESSSSWREMDELGDNIIPDGYIQPSGTLTITKHGTSDVTNYEEVVVNITPIKFTVTTYQEVAAGVTTTMYANNGMTWGEWLDTVFCVEDLSEVSITVDGVTYNALHSAVVDGVYTVLVDADDNIVQSTDTIISEHAYQIQNVAVDS